MITEKQKHELKKYLGNRYTKGVLDILKKQKVSNSNGMNYSCGSIRNVLAGKQENEIIETAIYEYYAYKKKQINVLEGKRKELFK